MEPIIVRKATTNLYVLLALSVLLLLVFVYIFSDHYTMVTILIFAVLSIFPVGLFIYALRELIKKTPQITFTQEALVTNGNNVYTWKSIDGFEFSREQTGSDNAGRIYKNYITLLLKDGTAGKIPVSHLDRTAEEIIYLIESYKRRSEDGWEHVKQ